MIPSTLTKLTLLAFLLVLTGCSSDRDATHARIESLNVTREHLVAVVVNGDARVVVELQRGPDRPEGALIDEAIDSPFEADILVLDRHDRAFLAEFGGDASLRPEWSAKFQPPGTEFSRSERLEDLRLVLTAADLLEGEPRVQLFFRWQVASLRHMAIDTLSDETWQGIAIEGEPTPAASEIVHQAEGEVVHVPPAAPASTDADETNGVVGTHVAGLSSTYRHRASIRWARCCVSFGDHSAVQLRVYDSGGSTLLATVNTSNHGRSASDPAMQDTVGCPRTWIGRANFLPPLQPYLSSDTYNLGNAGGCGTRYDAIFPTAGGHVCNDDSLAEYWHVKYNATSSWITCGDSDLRQRAPACD